MLNTNLFFKHSYSTIHHQISSSSNHNKSSNFKKYSKFVYKYFAWCLFGSCAFNLSILKSNYNEYKERMEFRINDLEEITQRLKNGENVDDVKINDRSGIFNNNNNNKEGKI